MPILDRDRERKIVIEGLKQGKSEAFIKSAIIADRNRTIQKIEQPFKESPQQRQNKVAQVKVDQAKAEAESKKANSFMGKLGNFGKAVVSNIAPSETGLGQSITKIFGNQSKSYSESAQKLSDSQAKLLKLIREKKARGEDVSKLEGMYNENSKQTKGLRDNVNEESKLPSAKKVTGQVAGTALDILTAGTYGKATQGMKPGTLTKARPSILPNKPQKFLSKDTAKEIAVGAATGYGFDVTHGLQQEEENPYKPGLGTTLGVGIPVAGRGLPGLKNTVQNKVSTPARHANNIRKNEAGLQKLEDSYATVRKVTQKAKEKGIESKKILAETDLLRGSVDKTGTIRTSQKGGAIEQLTNFIKPQEDVISQNLKKEGVKLTPKQVEDKLISIVDSTNIKGADKIAARNQIKRELKGLLLEAEDGMIYLSTIHDAKVYKYANINYLNPSAKNTDKAIARGFKELVEEHTKSVDVKELNAELSKHFAVLDLLEKLDGKKVEGGRLGRYFAQTVGAVVGSHFGPLGAVAGAEAGGLIRGRMMSSKFSGKTGGTLKTSEAMNSAMQKGAQSSNSLGNLNSNQITTIPKTTKKGIGSIVSRHKKTPNKQGGSFNFGAIFGKGKSLQPKPQGPSTKIPILAPKGQQSKLPVTDRVKKFMSMDKDRILLEVEIALEHLRKQKSLNMNRLEVEEYFEEVLRTPLKQKISDGTKEVLADLLAKYSPAKTPR